MSQFLFHNPRVTWFLRFGLSVFLLALLFTQVDLPGVFANLRLINARWFALALALYFGIHVLWAYQMSLALRPLGLCFTIPRLSMIILISTFYGLVLPGSVIAGGAVSWYKLSRSNRKQIEVGALLIYLRLIDIVTLLGIGLVGLGFDQVFSSPYFRLLVGAMFVAIVLISLPFFFPAVTRPMEQAGEIVLSRVLVPRWIRDKGGTLWKALKAFQTLDRRTIGLIFSLSLASHLLGVVLYYLVALAINMHVSILVIGWIRSLMGIIQLIPFSIAGLGLREASVVLLLPEYGVSPSQALIYSLTIFGLMVVGGLVGGAVEAWDVLFDRHRA